MKFSWILLFGLVLGLQAGVDFVPVFDDAPVPAERRELVEAALPAAPIVEVGAKRRILIVSATAGFRHASIPTGKYALERMGAVTGAYYSVISDDPANFEPEVLKSFDAVVLLNTTMDFFMPDKNRIGDFTEADLAWLQARQDRLMDNLVAYVAQGGGLVGIHAATDSCYGHAAYGATIGGYFWGHPWTGRHRVTIEVEDPEHATIRPVFGEVRDFELVEEIYQFKPEPYSRDRLRILLRLDPARSDPAKGMQREDNDYPVAWVQSVGEGRVFYTSLGHNHHIFWNPMLLRHYLAGIQFACGDLEADTTPSNRIQMPNLSKSCACEGH